MAHQKVFFDITVDSTAAGRIIIDLFVDKAPQACESFRNLCMGMHPGLTYQGSALRYRKELGLLQANAIAHSGARQDPGKHGAEFDAGNISWQNLSDTGLICMAKSGKRRDLQQFFITLTSSEPLNNQYVPFGRVVSDHELLQHIAGATIATSPESTSNAFISHCGELEARSKETTGLAKVGDKRVKPSRNSEDRDGRKKLRSLSRGPSALGGNNYRRPGKDHAPSRESSRQRRPMPRRRSDRSFDGNRRGRSREASCDRDHEDYHEEHEPRSPSPHERQRSPSPGRGREKPGSRSNTPPFRRRRSLPNHYERFHQKSNNDRRTDDSSQISKRTTSRESSNKSLLMGDDHEIDLRSTGSKEIKSAS